VKVADIGRVRIVETRLAGGQTVKLVIEEGHEIPSKKAKLSFDPSHTFIYENSWLAGASS
jgi:glycerol transport system ATP-binding protein